MLIYLVIYFVINSCANTPSAQSVSAELQECRIWISCASSYGARFSFPSMPRRFLQRQPAIKALLPKCAIWLSLPCTYQCRTRWMQLHWWQGDSRRGNYVMYLYPSTSFSYFFKIPTPHLFRMVRAKARPSWNAVYPKGCRWWWYIRESRRTDAWGKPTILRKSARVNSVGCECNQLDYSILLP